MSEQRTKASDFSSKLIEKMYSWHGGQGSPLYRVASNDGDVPVSAVEDAVRELGICRRQVLGMKPKGYKKELRELDGMIDELTWIADARSKGHEPV